MILYVCNLYTMYSLLSYSTDVVWTLSYGILILKWLQGSLCLYTPFVICDDGISYRGWYVKLEVCNHKRIDSIRNKEQSTIEAYIRSYSALHFIPVNGCQFRHDRRLTCLHFPAGCQWTNRLVILICQIKSAPRIRFCHSQSNTWFNNKLVFVSRTSFRIQW